MFFPTEENLPKIEENTKTVQITSISDLHIRELMQQQKAPLTPHWQEENLFQRNRQAPQIY